jgi:hypothetical protein
VTNDSLPQWIRWEGIGFAAWHPHGGDTVERTWLTIVAHMPLTEGKVKGEGTKWLERVEGNGLHE